MTANRIKRTLPLTALASTVAVLAGVSNARAVAYTGPVKEIMATHFGREVNLTEAGKGTTLEDFCSQKSGNTCRSGKESGIAGGFIYPKGVALKNDPTNPDVYVADTNNNRVQQISPAGAFVSMFGGEINKTKDEAVKAKEAKGETPTAGELREENVCTAISGNVCKAGVAGGRAEQINGDYSIAVDQSNGDVFVTDLFNWRVDEYTSTGQFVLMVGKDVNETREKEGAPQAQRDVCTLASGDTCKSGVRGAPGTSEAGAFNYAQGSGDLLAVDGSKHLLYVGDEHRVQEFDTVTGEWKEISLVSVSAQPEDKVVAIALEEATGDLYVAYRVEDVAHVIREFDATGKAINKPFEIRSPLSPLGTVTVEGLAVDAVGRLAVTEFEYTLFGSVYVGATGHRLTEFANPGSFGSSGIAFNATGEQDELYGAVSSNHEVVGYTAVHVAELLTSPVTCKPGGDNGTSATFACTLNGHANPEEVENTDAWFQWGLTPAFGKETPVQTICTVAVTCGDTLVPVKAVVEGLHPNQTYYYGLAGFDQNAPAAEKSPLTSETGSFPVQSAPPRIVGAPSVPFVRSSSVVLFAELNPENAMTRYEFQYAQARACEGREHEVGHAVEVGECPGMQETGVLESDLYGKIGATLEATGLQPATAYRDRLLAKNEHKETATGEEGVFTTSPAAVVRAVTGTANAIGTTSALVSGTIDPDGVSATYSFELGVYTGATTQYGVVFSGPAGTGSAFVEKTLALTGLQAGTTYAYRIKVSSPGYGAAEGAPVVFTTLGLPEVLPVPTPLAMLAVPSISFPAVVSSKSTTKALTSAQKLAKALKACKKDKSKKQRATCEKQARKQYVVNTNAKGKKHAGGKKHG
jgi:hypothetical protein